MRPMLFHAALTIFISSFHIFAPSPVFIVERDTSEAGSLTSGPKIPGPDDWHPAPPTAAGCLRLVEVFARPTGQIGHRQWVKIRNTCNVEISTDRTVLRWTQPGAGWSGAAMALAGIDVIGPGMCVTVGGPDSVKANFLPEFDLPIAFSPTDLEDGSTEVAGVSLFTAGGVLPFDSVAYGHGVAAFPDSKGKPAVSVLAKMEMGHSLLRTAGGWVDSIAPSPNTCSALSVAPANDEWSSGCFPVESVDEKTFCAKHPWGRPSTCGESPSASQCADMLDVFDGCGVTTCEFAACAAALATAPCGSTPTACVGISTCSN